MRIVEQFSLAGVFHVILTGGEPLINIGGLLFLMAELKARNITFSLNSNLTLITPKIATQLKRIGLNTILTSLFSYDLKTHDFLSGHPGSFLKVVEGIEVARNAGLRVAANMVVVRSNLNQIEETGRYAKNIGVFAFSATRVMPPRISDGKFDERLVLQPSDVRSLFCSLVRLQDTGLQLDSLVPYPTCFFCSTEEYDFLGNRTCSAGKTSMAIAADGGARACPHHETIYGSLKDEEITSLWEKMQEWRNGSFLPKICRSCNLLPRCGGGCRVSSISPESYERDSIMDEEKARAIFFPPQKKTSISINLRTQMMIRQECRFRKDDSIGIINTGGLKNAFVAIATWDVLNELHEKRIIFTPESLRESHGIKMNEGDYLAFLFDLVSRDVAKILVA